MKKVLERASFPFLLLHIWKAWKFILKTFVELNKLTVKWLMEFVTWVFIWGFGLGMNVRVKLFIVVIGEGNLLLALWWACYSTEVGEISAYWCGWIKDQLRKIETERAFNVKMNIFYNSLNPMGKIITFNGNLNTRSPLIPNVWKWWIDPHMTHLHKPRYRKIFKPQSNSTRYLKMFPRDHLTGYEVKPFVFSVCYIALFVAPFGSWLLDDKSCLSIPTSTIS